MLYSSAVRKVKKEIWQIPLICFTMIFFFISNRGRTDIESLEKIFLIKTSDTKSNKIII